jgi:prevent-host-death family protein
MPRPPDTLDLNVDLAGGVVPISKATSALAALIKRSRERQQPIVITQKGYPSGVILPIDLFTALRERAEQVGGGQAASPASDAPPMPAPVELSPPELEAPAPEAPAPPRARGGRKAKSKPAQDA